MSKRMEQPAADAEERREIENLLAFAYDPASIRVRIAKRHRELDKRAGRAWNCPCAACRVERSITGEPS